MARPHLSIQRKSIMGPRHCEGDLDRNPLRIIDRVFGDFNLAEFLLDRAWRLGNGEHLSDELGNIVFIPFDLGLPSDADHNGPLLIICFDPGNQLAH